VALVTWSSRGIGPAIAHGLARNGATGVGRAGDHRLAGAGGGRFRRTAFREGLPRLASDASLLIFAHLTW
jgi:NAD(P)-dependent dehydrogenase (short-subunit alcohol dehydrogenase family)